MTLTSGQISGLNKMCVGAKEATLGTYINTLLVAQAGTHTLTGGEASAGSVSIASGLSTLTAVIGNVFRSGSAMSDVNITKSSTNIVLKSTSGSYTMTSGDIFNWVAF